MNQKNRKSKRIRYISRMYRTRVKSRTRHVHWETHELKAGKRRIRRDKIYSCSGVRVSVPGGGGGGEEIGYKEVPLKRQQMTTTGEWKYKQKDSIVLRASSLSFFSSAPSVFEV